MKRKSVLARILRGAAGKSQAQAAADIGRTAQQLHQWERGRTQPSEEDLTRLAERCAEITREDADEILALLETRRDAFRRRGERNGVVLEELSEKLTRFCAEVIQSLVTLPPPEHQPSPEDRQEAERQFAELASLRARPRLAVVKLTPRFHNWALVERCCAAAVEEMSNNLERAATWVRLALAIAKWLPGSEPWQSRNRGYARAHWAEVLKAHGKAKLAKTCEEQAARLWLTGADPGGLLDSSRLPALSEAPRVAGSAHLTPRLI